MPNEQQTTIYQLFDDLLKLVAEGKGNTPIKLQTIKSGITFSQNIGASIGDPADGNIFWIYPIGKVQLPGRMK